MPRTDYLTLAHAAPTDLTDPEALHNYLDLGNIPANPSHADAGIVLALHDRFPDLPEWETDFKGLREAAGDLLNRTVGVPATNDYYLARWAVLGPAEGLRTDLRDPLAELVRRAMNRDGSNGADSVGSDAIGLLSEAEAVDPALAADLAASNFSLARLKFGNFPAGSFSLPLVAPAVGPQRHAPAAASAPATGSTEAAARYYRALFIPAPTPPPDGSPVANRDAGMVDLGGVKLTISAAIRLSEGLARAATELVRPAEGFAWLNDSADPQARSILVDLDGKRGEGLPDVGGGLCQAEVIQVAARGPDPNAGKYIGRIYNRSNGYSEFKTESDDMNTAKFMVAERVRGELPTT